jgi:hypothetical protein
MKEEIGNLETMTGTHWEFDENRAQIIVGQSQTLINSQIIFSTLFSASAQHCYGIQELLQSVQLYGTKTIFLNESNIFYLFIIQVYCAHHIPSTAGGALTQHKIDLNDFTLTRTWMNIRQRTGVFTK